MHPSDKTNVRKPSGRLALIFLSALFALAAILVFIRRPGHSLAFDTLHPRTQQALLELGVEPGRVAQGLGLAPASAGTHGIDGWVERRPYCAAFDLDVIRPDPRADRRPAAPAARRGPCLLVARAGSQLPRGNAAGDRDRGACSRP